MISSLLQLVGLRSQVCYTLTNFRGGGSKAPLPPPQHANATYSNTYTPHTYTPHTYTHPHIQYSMITTASYYDTV